MVTASSKFVQAACKRLSRHDVDPTVTNGHEFQGVKQLRLMLGTINRAFDCRFVHLADEIEPIWDDSAITWYEVGRRDRAPEYRAYYRTALVWSLAQPGDHLYLVETLDYGFIALIVRPQSVFDTKVEALLGIDPDRYPYIDYRTDDQMIDLELLQDFSHLVGLSDLSSDLTSRFETAIHEVLDQRHVSPDEVLTLPTVVVSEIARDISERLENCGDDPDDLLVLWSETELQLFMYLETRRLMPIVESGFDSVDSFIGAAMTAIQVRKSRAGHSLQNHFGEILRRRGLAYRAQCVTEGQRRPDFVFPGIDEYHDPEFPDHGLTMVAVKRTCKDRWRQVVTEAARIPTKHLLTLEHPISTAQTDEMAESGVRLVVPRAYSVDFTDDQRSWVLSVSELLDLLDSRQRENPKAIY